MGVVRARAGLGTAPARRDGSDGIDGSDGRDGRDRKGDMWLPQTGSQGGTNGGLGGDGAFIIGSVRPNLEPYGSPSLPAEEHGLSVTWTDLIDVAPGERVVLVGPRDGPAAAALRGRGADVFGPDDDVTWADLVCVEGCRLGGAERRRLRGLLADGGRWVQISDNLLSPLRIADAVAGRPRGGDPRPGPGSVLRALRRDGLDVAQVFVLLRSTLAPVTAFDTASPLGAAATLSATLTHVTGGRGLLLRVLRRLPAGVAARVAPGWLVVAGPGSRPPGPPAIVGKIANRDSTEVKILRGDPPEEVERHHLVGVPVPEAAALRALEKAGFAEAPRLLGTSAAAARYSWLGGHSLLVNRLGADGLVTWTGRAAALLARMQHLTRETDGTVLVHGDFWLGNLLVEGDTITGVVDWGAARRGSPDIDRRFLVASLAARHRSDPQLRSRLEAACDAVLPGRLESPPPAGLLGVPAGPAPVLAQAPAVVGLGDAGPGEVAAWVAEQPVPPVLLPVSAAGLGLASRHRDHWVGARLLLPPAEVVEELLELGPGGVLHRHGLPVADPGSAGPRLHVFVDVGGTLVGPHLLDPAGDLQRVSRHPDLLALARRVVAALELRGALALGAAPRDDGSWGVHSVEPWLTPEHVAVAAAGVDIGSLWYADLAGLARPRSALDDAGERGLRASRAR